MKLNNDFLKGLFALFLLVGISSAAMAQTVRGTLTDAETGEALIGANVLVVGTSTGTITDFDGTYSVNLTDGATKLLFTYTGYQNQEVDIAGREVIDIQMSSGTLLDEVVVVGYGTTTRGEATSAVASIKEEDFNQGQVNDPVQLIQGKVAGLSISTPGGDPNGNAVVRLRGLNNLGASSSPLVVIDGVIGGTLQSVDPSDIASIDVLKDGSAAAIYGTRASAGVILITTKKGSAGAPTVSYSGLVTTESVGRRVQTTDAAEFLRLRESGYRTSNPGASEQEVTDFMTNLVDAGGNTNWLDNVTQSALSQVHNLSMAGGTGKTTYRASFNVRDVQGVGIGTGFQQLNGRLNLNQKAMNDRLTIGLNMAANQREVQRGFAEAFRYGTTYNPTAPINFQEGDLLFDKYGGYYQQELFDYYNPVAIAEQSINTGTLKSLLVSISGAYELTDGLTARVAYSRQQDSDLNGEFYNRDGYFRGTNAGGFASRFTEDRSNELFEFTGTYDVDLGSTNMEILGGYSWNELGKENVYTESQRFLSNDITYNNLGFSELTNLTQVNVGSYKEVSRIIGFFGRAKFNINDIYNLSLSLRREGSSKFGADNQWGWFPGASASVDISKLADISSVDQLKLRASYGVTGGLPRDAYLSQFTYNKQGSFYYNGGFVPAYGPARNANPSLRYEKKSDYGVGLDFAFADYKLTGSLDYYNTVTDDLLFFAPVSVPPNFAPNTWANLDDVQLQNSGVELSLTYNMGSTDGGFTWTPTVTLGTFKTTLNTVAVDNPEFAYFTGGGPVLDVSTSPGAPGQNDDPAIIVQGDEPLGQLYGPVYEGISETGDWVFKTDANGDVVEEVIGNGLPTLTAGFLNSFTFGSNWNASFFLRGDFGHDLANMYRNFYESLGNGNSRAVDNIVKTDYFDENLVGAPTFSSYYVEAADYLVLDNATIGYRFDLAEGSVFSDVNVAVSGRNLFWLTNYQGVDPSPRYEDKGAVDNGGREAEIGNPLAPGLDRRNIYFTTRSFSLGLKATF